MQFYGIQIILIAVRMKDITDTVNDVCMVRRLARRCDCCYVTKWVTITSAHMGQSPVQTVPACPVQIGAHHHIDVCTDISDILKNLCTNFNLIITIHLLLPLGE